MKSVRVLRILVVCFGFVFVSAALYAQTPEPGTIQRPILTAVQRRALKHEQRLDLKAFDQAQKAKRAEFEEAERKNRHAYFASHPKGAERRQFIQDFLERRKQFNAGLKQERDEKLKSQRAQLKEAPKAP